MSEALPFQSWQKFKEAFAPELIQRAVQASKTPVRTLLDPFGGSGTTALAAQFMGISPITAEVNPYLCDLIEAKLTEYDISALEEDAEFVKARIELALASGAVASELHERWMPPTFVEPGLRDRWIFSRPVALFIANVLSAVEELDRDENKRLLRVLVGGTLVAISNIRVSGKGRRYRSNWQDRQRTVGEASEMIMLAFTTALNDIKRFNGRPQHGYQLLRGDVRENLSLVEKVDLAVFSPPYPNSFDYTDVYNVELWMLGYLSSMSDNRNLRTSTVSSHVQVHRTFSTHPDGSPTLDETISRLEASRADLWNRNIPEMIATYFVDMSQVFSSVSKTLETGGESWVVVGDSRYAGIDIPVGKILVELATNTSYELVASEPFRSMRSSPQQGGLRDLDETLIILRKA